MRPLLFLLALAVLVACVTARVKDSDGCSLVRCPQKLKGINNILPNPYGISSFCCCAGGTPKIAHCPGGKTYDHGSRDCVRPDN